MTTPANTNSSQEKKTFTAMSKAKGFRHIISAWWSEFSLQTKLLSVTTLVVSLVMTGITFLALNGIQRDTVIFNGT